MKYTSRGFRAQENKKVFESFFDFSLQAVNRLASFNNSIIYLFIIRNQESEENEVKKKRHFRLIFLIKVFFFFFLIKGRFRLILVFIFF